MNALSRRAASAQPALPGATGPLAAVAIDVRTEFDVAKVISAANRFCTGQALNNVFAAHVATAASELANNLWLYASHGGQVRLSMLHDGLRRGVELVAEDDGPGISDIALALTEGYSTGGGMGCGLPGVQRLMDELRIDSQPGCGTRVQARKWLHTHA